MQPIRNPDRIDLITNVAGVQEMMLMLGVYIFGQSVNQTVGGET